MKLLVLSLFVAVAAGATDLFGEHKTYAGYKVFEIIPTRVEHQDKLRHMMADEELDFWDESRKLGVTTRVMAPPHKVNKVVDYLNKYDIQHNVMIEDMSVNVLAELDRLQARASKKMVFDIDDFNTLDDIMTELDAMAARCPAAINCTVETLGQSDEGRDIKVVRISGGADRRGYWIDSAIHAREWLAPATVLKILDHLTRNYGTDTDVTDLIDTYDFHFIPVMNPDGYLYSWTDERMWRKSRNVNDESSCIGTDLNRNYDANWMSDGTSTNPCSDTYGGASPASAVETQVIQSEIVRLGSTLDGLLTIHTAAQMWLHPWGHTEGGSCAIAEDDNDFEIVINAAVDEVEATNGLRFDRGNCCLTIYPASGGTMDFGKLVGGVKYTFTPELRGPNFVIDASNIDPSFQETFNGLKVLIASIEATG